MFFFDDRMFEFVFAMLWFQDAVSDYGLIGLDALSLIGKNLLRTQLIALELLMAALIC